jgi:hypothetical protein
LQVVRLDERDSAQVTSTQHLALTF